MNFFVSREAKETWNFRTKIILEATAPPNAKRIPVCLLHVGQGLCANRHMRPQGAWVPGSRRSGGTQAWSARSRAGTWPREESRCGSPHLPSPANRLGEQGPRRPSPAAPLPAEKEARPGGRLSFPGSFSLTCPPQVSPAAFLSLHASANQ